MKESLPPEELIVEADLVLDDGITVTVRCLIDTGAQASTLSREIFYRHYGLGVPLEPAGRRLVAANGHELRTDGQFITALRIQGHSLPVLLIIGEIQQEVVLGMDFMAQYKVTWDWDEKVLHLGAVRRPDL